MKNRTGQTNLQQVFKSSGLNGLRANATFHSTSLRETSFNTGPLLFPNPQQRNTPMHTKTNYSYFLIIFLFHIDAVDTVLIRVGIFLVPIYFVLFFAKYKAVLTEP